MTPKASFYSNTYAITECKNGKALVKHGNFLPWLDIKRQRTVTRATQSVRLNREMREGTLPPTPIAKTYHPGNVADVSRPLIRSLSYEF